MMKQQVKRFKPTRESMVTDIASSIEHIAESTKSMSESFTEILKVNKAVVMHIRYAEEFKEKLNLDQTVVDLGRTSIKEKH